MFHDFHEDATQRQHFSIYLFHAGFDLYMKHSKVKVLDSIFRDTKESLIVDFVERSIWKAVLQQFLPLSCRWAIVYSVTWQQKTIHSTDADFGFTFSLEKNTLLLLFYKKWTFFRNSIWLFHHLPWPPIQIFFSMTLNLAFSYYSNDETF